MKDKTFITYDPKTFKEQDSFYSREFSEHGLIGYAAYQLMRSACVARFDPCASNCPGSSKCPSYRPHKSGQIGYPL